MNYSVCIDAVYDKYDFYSAVEELGKNNIKNIEFWRWWDKDLNRLLDLKKKYGLNIVGFCTMFYSMVDPKEKDLYLKAIKRGCEVAEKLGCKQIYTKPGDSTEESFEVQYQRMKETLNDALKIASDYDVTILLEPVNSKFEAPNTFLNNSDLGFRVIDEIKNQKLMLLYDIYHMQIDEGDVLHRVLPRISQIGHIHIAGSMDRHEIWDGELNYDYILRKIEESGYSRGIGLEYFPVKEPLRGVKEIIEKHNFL